jgi:collagen beta-1,O-galactosyltransferase
VNDFSVKFPPMTSHRLLTEFVTHPPKDRLGFDEIFMINLERRPERRLRMECSFTELGIDFKWIKAVDGRSVPSAP